MLKALKIVISLKSAYLQKNKEEEKYFVHDILQDLPRIIFKVYFPLKQIFTM